MKKINSDLLIAMFKNGANQMFSKMAKINALNVFPVPDGDTGTNMNFTVLSGLKEIENIKFNSAHQVAKQFAKGCLMGARGNSGVITSQIFKGFSQGLEGVKEIEGANLINAFSKAKDAAYSSVAKPVEGTILTLISDLAKATKKADFIDAIQFFKLIMIEGNKSVARTPDLLPVLKDAGVVDAGAYGMREFIFGMVATLFGRTIEREVIETNLVDNDWMADDVHNGEEFGYCTEFIVLMNEENQNKIKDIDVFKELSIWGNSVAVVVDEEILKIHIHTETPELVMKFAHQFGEFKTIKIENMQEQFNEIIASNQKRKSQTMVAISPGDGITNAFKQRNVNYVISGGQTMNPSTEEIMQAVKKANADSVFILPNNSNIILAAKQTIKLLPEIKIEVIESKTVAEGLSAALMFDELSTWEENKEKLNEALDEVSTGEVTTSIKSTELNGVKIKKDDYIAIVNGKIISSNKSMVDSSKEIIDRFDGLDIITIIKGKDAKGTDELVDYIESKDLEVEIINGEQPLYPFIIGAE